MSVLVLVEIIIVACAPGLLIVVVLGLPPIVVVGVEVVTDAVVVVDTIVEVVGAVDVIGTMVETELVRIVVVASVDVEVVVCTIVVVGLAPVPVDSVTVAASNVTALCAYSAPVSVAPVFMTIAVLDNMIPWKLEVVPRVA